MAIGICHLPADVLRYIGALATPKTLYMLVEEDGGQDWSTAAHRKKVLAIYDSSERALSEMRAEPRYDFRTYIEEIALNSKNEGDRHIYHQIEGSVYRYRWKFVSPYYCPYVEDFLFKRPSVVTDSVEGLVEEDVGTRNFDRFLAGTVIDVRAHWNQKAIIASDITRLPH